MWPATDWQPIQFHMLISHGHHSFVQNNATQERESQAPLFSGSSATFKPFRKDPAKQDRYDRYLALLKSGTKGNFLQN